MALYSPYILIYNTPVGTKGFAYIYCYPNDPGWGSSEDTIIYLIIIERPEICAITSDPDNHPVIYIDSSSLPGNTTISLQRQVTATSWQTIANINFNDSLVITDLTANTSLQSYNYRLEADKAACNGAEVRTIRLQANGNNLFWNAGGGVGLDGYYIYKKDVSGTFNLIDSTPNLTYTDPNFQNGDEYFVEAVKLNGCQSTAWRSTGATLSIKSNRLTIGVSGIETVEPKLKYYVISNTLYVELDKATDIYISDVSGRKIAHEFTDKYSVQLSGGMYIL